MHKMDGHTENQTDADERNPNVICSTVNLTHMKISAEYVKTCRRKFV